MSVFALKSDVIGERMNHINDVAFNAWNCLRGMSPSALLWTCVASVVVAFSVWQARAQWDRTRRFDVYAQGLSEREAKFLQRQTRRRMQIAILAGIVGAFMVAGLVVPLRSAPKFVATCWSVVLLFGAWTCLLAVVDAVSVWISFSDERVRRDAEKRAIEYHMKRFRDSQLDQVARSQDAAKASEGGLDERGARRDACKSGADAKQSTSSEKNNVADD